VNSVDSGCSTVNLLPVVWLVIEFFVCFVLDLSVVRWIHKWATFYRS
jgi:hypothetical protein